MRRSVVVPGFGYRRRDMTIGSVFCLMRRALSSKSTALFLCASFLGGGELYAQLSVSPEEPVKNLSLGFDVSFGTRLFQLQSNMGAIDGMNVLEEGGTAGVVFGNPLVQVKLRQGYFYSASSVRYTTDLIETGIEMNINLMQLSGLGFRQWEPYVLAGVTRDAVKFHGHYLDISGGTSTTYQDRGGSQKPNYSRSEMPYLGSVVLARLEAGCGVQYRVKVMESFVHLFGEVRYGYAVGSSASQQFENTSAAHQLSLSIGTSFGWKL